MTRDDCLIVVVPFFVPPISPSPPRRLPCRPRAAGRAASVCLPQSASPSAIRSNPSISHEMTLVAGRIAIPPPADRSVFLYILATRKVGIFVSPCDEGSFPPHAPHIRHGERGEVTRRLLAATISSGGSAAARSTYSTGQIRFAHFPCRADFPVALPHRRAIL